MAPVHDPHLPADHACLIVHGSDKPGIVAAVSAMITRIGGLVAGHDRPVVEALTEVGTAYGHGICTGTHS